MYRLLLLVTAVLGASHLELTGEEPSQEDVDSGQCIPIRCSLGVPPEECTRQCALRHYIPICKPPGDFCLCQRLVDNKVELVSPDEVEEEPPSGQDNSLSFFAILFVPITKYFHEESSEEESLLSPSAEPFGYGTVNVHEGRLFWDFRYILSGLFLLMVGLVVYELVMCRVQTHQTKHDCTDTKIHKVFSA